MIYGQVLAGSIELGIGLIAGSFIATLVVRWPEDRVMTGRSACDSCGAILNPTDLVPLISFLAKRGKCTLCSAHIDRTHPVIEALCGIISLTALTASPDLAGACAAVIGWLLVALAMLDFRHLWLPDRLTIAVAGVAVGSGLLVLQPSMWDRLIGGTAGFAALSAVAWCYVRIRHREGLGRGDPKLFGAIGLWLGWQQLPFVLIGASGMGLLVVATMVLRGKVVAATMRLPFGTLLAVAALSVWLLSR